MELHYYTLKRQAKELSEICRDARIEACFTQKKNELTLQLWGKENRAFQLILSTDPDYPFLLHRNFQKRASQSKDVLQTLKAKKISRFSIMSADRIIIMHFHSTPIRLFMQYFLKRTNFFVIGENDIVLEAFKQNKKYSGQRYAIPGPIRTELLEKKMSEFTALIRRPPHKTLYQQLKKSFFEMNNTILREIEYRSKIDLSQNSAEINEKEMELLYHTVQKFLQQCLQDRPRVYIKENVPFIFSLTTLEHLQNLPVEFFLNLNEALTYFIFKKKKSDENEQLTHRLRTLIDNKIEQINLVMSRLHNQPDEDVQRKNYQKWGELILAQYHDIPKGISPVRIRDLYDPNQNFINIDINPELSLPENAQQYFDKARKVAENLRRVKQNLHRLQKQKQEILKIQTLLQNQLDGNAIKKIEQKLKEMHILQTDPEKLQEIYRPYKQYFFEGWEIWVGKSARDNDALTFQKAHKEDTWMHAQGVSGSHVIVRHKKPTQNPPQNVISYAARLAGGNSKAKHSTVVPVMMTKVKYVRKPKGSAPGAVSAERVKTLFAEPFAH